MITASDLGKDFGAQTLFRGASFQLNPGGRYGLVGANGSGKTTLLRIFTGQDVPSTGAVSLPKKLRLGILEQDHFRYEELPILEVMMMGHETLWQAMAEKETILEQADTDFDGDRYAELEDIVVSLDGYSFEARAGEILEGLGIPSDQHRQPLSTLSGGFKLRVLLAQVLAADPDCLLLDEPTNHLDILSIRWLEKFLLDYPGCAVVISHDHRFSNNVCTHILDVDYETVTLYTGNFAAFTEAKGQERDAQRGGNRKREKEIADHQAFVDRFRAKDTKARQAQSKVKQIEKLVIEPLPRSSRRYPVFTIHAAAAERQRGAQDRGDQQVLRRQTRSQRCFPQRPPRRPNRHHRAQRDRKVDPAQDHLGHLEADTGTVSGGTRSSRATSHRTTASFSAESDRNGGELARGACPGQSIGSVRAQLAQVLFSGDEVEKKVAQPVRRRGRAVDLRPSRGRPPQRADPRRAHQPPRSRSDRGAGQALERLRRHSDLRFPRPLVRLAARDPRPRDHREGITTTPAPMTSISENCGDDHLDAEASSLRAKRERKKATGSRAARSIDAAAKRSAKRKRDLALRLEVVTAAVEKAESRIEAIDAAFCRDGFFDDTDPAKIRAMQNERADLEAEIAAFMEEWESIEAELAG